MKQAFLTDRKFIIEEQTVPEWGVNQVLVKSAGCGICEGDLFQYKTSGGRREPVALGHEGSGVVMAAGQGVTGFKPGDRVTALGGTYAEYFVADASSLIHVPDNVDITRALGEPLACCVHAAARFGIRPGDRVAIIGCGYMGIVCMQLARLMGAAEIMAFDLLPWRLELAKELGADVTVNSTGKRPETLAGKAGEFDVVIEATGVEDAVTLGGLLLRHHGTLNLVGYHQSGEGMRTVDMKMWNFKALNVINGHVRNAEEKLQSMETAMKLLAAARLDTGKLIKDYRFADINEAFAALENRAPGLLKANLIFG